MNNSHSFKESIESEINKSTGQAQRNYRSAYLLTLIGAAASIAATIFVALGEVDYNKEFVAVIAAIPAASILLENKLRLEERSRWQWNRLVRIKALFRALEYEGVSEKMISAQWSQLEIEMQEKFVGLNKKQ